MPEPEMTAKQISEDLLNRSGTGLMTGNFDLFAPCFALPHRVVSFDGERDLTSVDELRQVFDGVRKHFAERQVTLLHRTCVSAAFLDADTVQATHETRLIARTTIVQQPYPVLSILRRIGGVWQVARSEYAIVDAPSHSKTLGTAH